MSFRNVSRRSLAAVAVAATAAVGAVALGSGSAEAGTSTVVTLTKVSVHRLPATTANQVITVTGTGFDESVINSVAINGCTTDPTYIVQSPTSLLVKTSADCATTSTGVITVTDTSSNTAVTNPAATGGAMALVFVDAPTIATSSATVHPVVTDNSSGVAYANQVATASTKGGTTVRITKGSVAFVNTTAFPLAASLDGVALTKVTMHTGGDYFTGVLGAHAADAAPVLKITSNGVSKSFAWHAGGASGTAGTHDFTYAGQTISVTPAFGAINGGTVLKVTGVFNAAAGSPPTITVGGTACTVTAHTGTSATCTVPAATTAGPATVAVTAGATTSVVGSGSTFTYVSQ